MIDLEKKNQHLQKNSLLYHMNQALLVHNHVNNQFMLILIFHIEDKMCHSSCSSRDIEIGENKNLATKVIQELLTQYQVLDRWLDSTKTKSFNFFTMLPHRYKQYNGIYLASVYHGVLEYGILKYIFHSFSLKIAPQRKYHMIEIDNSVFNRYC